MYEPLAAFLRASSRDAETLDFAGIERILGRPLPPSARTDPSWWANATAGRQQGQAWLGAGWRVGSCRLTAEAVTFERVGEPGPGVAMGGAEP